MEEIIKENAGFVGLLLNLGGKVNNEKLKDLIKLHNLQEKEGVNCMPVPPKNNHDWRIPIRLNKNIKTRRDCLNYMKENGLEDYILMKKGACISEDYLILSPSGVGLEVYIHRG